MNGRQIGEARRLLGWSSEDLAAAARVALKATVTAEHQADGVAIPRRQETALRRALEAAGVEFVTGDDGGAGVRLKKSVVE